MPTTPESYMKKKKRKDSGSIARKKKRNKIKAEIENMGIFKELKNERSKRSIQG